MHVVFITTFVLLCSCTNEYDKVRSKSQINSFICLSVLQKDLKSAI